MAAAGAIFVEDCGWNGSRLFEQPAARLEALEHPAEMDVAERQPCGRAGGERIRAFGDCRGSRFFEQWATTLETCERVNKMEAAARRLAGTGAAERAADVLETL
jgi:hypothetical protein